MNTDKQIIDFRSRDCLTLREWFSLYVRKQKNIDCLDVKELTWEESRLITKPYKAKDEAEKLEFDRLILGWQNIQYAQMNAELATLSALGQCYKIHSLLLFFLSNDHDFNFIENYLESYPINKIYNTNLLDHSWIKIEDLSYLFFLEEADLGLLKDLWILNKNILSDDSYLNDQKKIADILISAGGLNDVAKNEIAKEIINRILSDDGCFRWYNFASLQTIDIGRYCVKNNSIRLIYGEAEKKELASYGHKSKELILLGNRIRKYVQENNIDLHAYLLKIIKQFLDEGLLDACKPLYGNNQRIRGWRNDMTNYTGEKIYQEWQVYEKRSKQVLQDLFNRGKFKKHLIFTSEDDKKVEVISARDLYLLDNRSKLVEDFRKQQLEQEILGRLINLWDSDTFNKYQATLKESIKIIEESSKQLDIDVNYKIDKIKDGIREINELLDFINGQFTHLVFMKTKNCDETKSRSRFSIKIKISRIDKIII